MDNLAGSKQINRPGSVIWVRHRHFVASAAAAPGFLAGRLRDQELSAQSLARDHCSDLIPRLLAAALTVERCWLIESVNSAAPPKFSICPVRASRSIMIGSLMATLTSPAIRSRSA